MSNILEVILRDIGGYIKTKFAVTFSEGRPRPPSNEFCGHLRSNGLFTKLESGFLKPVRVAKLIQEYWEQHGFFWPIVELDEFWRTKTIAQPLQDMPVTSL